MNSDTFGVRIICSEEALASYLKTRTRQDASFVDITCNPGDFLLSGGYTKISAGKATSSAPRPGNSPRIWRVTASRPADITAVVVCYNLHVCRTSSPATCVPRKP